MKDREIQCIHYVCEGNCDLGKDGTFYGTCQTCKTYKKKAGSKPNRTDTRNERLKRAEKRSRRSSEEY